MLNWIILAIQIYVMISMLVYAIMTVVRIGYIERNFGLDPLIAHEQKKIYLSTLFFPVLILLLEMTIVIPYVQLSAED